jgi:Beta-lactamase enzyme family
MKLRGILRFVMAVVAGGVAASAFAAPAVVTANAAGDLVVTGAICSSASHSALARLLSRDILAAMRDRMSSVGLAVDDPGAGLACGLASDSHYDSASTVKATILAALLREKMEEHQSLTGTERELATEMITESDNDAASDLWYEVGPAGMQHFLDLAKMTQTILGTGPYWGLTQITARDETRLLGVLTTQNSVLDATARAYELRLMASVIPDQRWGVSAGAPAAVTVHLKNGWLPLTSGWVINSIGCFDGADRYYSIVVLTDNDPSMTYGIDTIEDVARVVNRELGTVRLSSP